MTIINNNMRNRFCALVMACCFIALLATSLVYRFTKPDLTLRQFPAQAGDSQEDAGAMNAIGQLMRHVAQNPQDKNALLRLVESLMAIGQWDTAENFAQKALALDAPDQQDPKAMYLLALVHHNKGQDGQAAELLEKLLEKSENPSARYSLGILYIHFLKQPEKGIEQLKKGLASGAPTPALARAMEEELEKAREKKPADDAPQGVDGGADIPETSFYGQPAHA